MHYFQQKQIANKWSKWFLFEITEVSNPKLTNVSSSECSKYYAHWVTVSATGNFKFFQTEREKHVPQAWMRMCMSKQQKIFWKSSLTLYFTSTLIHLHNISPGHSHVYIYNVMCSSTRKRVRELEIIFHPCPYSDFDASCGMRIPAAADSTTSFSPYPSLCK
jgi:hypothetical protein